VSQTAFFQCWIYAAGLSLVLDTVFYLLNYFINFVLISGYCVFAIETCDLFEQLLLVTMATAKLTASSVTSSLKSGEYRIRLVSTGKSDVWKQFGIVIDGNDSEIDFAACRSCHQALAHSLGTSSVSWPLVQQVNVTSAWLDMWYLLSDPH